MTDHPDDAVRLRFLVAGGLPLVVGAIGDTGRGPQLRATLAASGLARLERFLGASLPQGARVGFVVDATELRLVDERDSALLRTGRAGIDEGWLAAARRLRGTMTVVVEDGDLEVDAPPGSLAAELDRRARAGEALGAVVGVVEERPTLPLLL